jgi:hypothetical protein
VHEWNALELFLRIIMKFKNSIKSILLINLSFINLTIVVALIICFINKNARYKYIYFFIPFNLLLYI